MLGKGMYLADGLYLFVGRDTAGIAAVRTRILQAFAWLAGATLILASLGGLVFSVQFLRRIDAITTNLQCHRRGPVQRPYPLARQ